MFLQVYYQKSSTAFPPVPQSQQNDKEEGEETGSDNNSPYSITEWSRTISLNWFNKKRQGSEDREKGGGQDDESDDGALPGRACKHVLLKMPVG